MIKIKTLIYFQIMFINILFLSNIISCKNISENKKISKNNNINLILKNNGNKWNKLVNYKKLKNNNLIDSNINSNFNYFEKNKYLNNGFYTYNNENIFIESNLIEEQKEKNNTQHNENANISKILFNELSEKREKHKEKINFYKKWMLGFGIATCIVVGVSTGLGIYFGIKNSDENVNKENENLQNQINFYRNIKSNDALAKVILKIIDIAFMKQLPQAILNFLKETILKESFEKLNEKFENELVEKIMQSKDVTKSAINNLLTELTKIDVKNKDINKINNDIKKSLTNIIEIYLPDLIKGVLNFITIESKEGTQSSILGDILIKILNESNIGIKNSHDFSIILKTYVDLITKKENNLINFIIEIASEAINKTELSSDIINDIFKMINMFIDILIARKSNNNSGKVIDVEKIVKILLPKLVKIINFDKDKNYSAFVSFINQIFENNNKNDSNFNWVYDLIEKGEISKNSKNNTKKENENRKIIIPRLDINSHEKFLVLLELGKISGFITKFFNLLYEPFVIELKKQEKQNEVKKAIVRLTGFISYIYYKLNNLKSDNKDTFFNVLKKDLNPANPKYAIPKAISKLLKKYYISDSIITDLFGKKVPDWYLYIFKSNSYAIFIEAEKEAKKQLEVNKESNLKEIFKQGNFQILNNKNK
ncbi:hypothetical protein [Mycoplasma phocimorsus]|uniref:hypothetical protein n=1 Tax=Mycoplasma phocimorsus TaxID=3045839 RepID=UPI0024BFEDB3|nr:hypothetical protein [Mycoplasma phocimorsus]MDJ1647625.1 hypothetical protein [Mycoplasma phocimorsus]